TGFIMAAHPRGLRRRGYAGAATAAVSLKAAELAEEVLLFTDVANPTSNALYQRVGRRVGHVREEQDLLGQFRRLQTDRRGRGTGVPASAQPARMGRHDEAR